MIPDEDSKFIKDLIELEVHFELIRTWCLNHTMNVTKKEIIDIMRKISSKAESISYMTKGPGYDYFKRVI